MARNARSARRRPPNTQSQDVPATSPDSRDPAFRDQISYIDRSRAYYRAEGFAKPYRWAKHATAPFTSLVKPLGDSKLGVVTTAFPVAAVADGEKVATASSRSPTPDAMFTKDLFWHKMATHTDDVESFLPLNTLLQLQTEGRIGSLSERYYSLPTFHSQRRARADALLIEQFCRQDQVEVVILIPL